MQSRDDLATRLRVFPEKDQELFYNIHIEWEKIFLKRQITKALWHGGHLHPWSNIRRKYLLHWWLRLLHSDNLIIKHPRDILEIEKISCTRDSGDRYMIDDMLRSRSAVQYPPNHHQTSQRLQTESVVAFTDAHFQHFTQKCPLWHVTDFFKAVCLVTTLTMMANVTEVKLLISCGRETSLMLFLQFRFLPKISQNQSFFLEFRQWCFVSLFAVLLEKTP